MCGLSGALALVVAFLLTCFATAADAAPSGGPLGQGAELSRREPTALPPRLVVGVVAGGWPPLEVFDGGTLTGFSADYLRLLVGTGVKLQARIFPDMPTLLAAACAGDIDIVMSLARTPSRERCLAFTVPYLSGNTAFVTRAGNTSLATQPERLAHAKFAVERGYALESALRERFAQARIKTFVSTQAALHAVAEGEADVYAGFAPVTRYQLTLDALRDLRVAFEERERMRELRYAVPVSKSGLRDRLDLLLAGVRPAAAATVRERWLGSEVHQNASSPTFSLSPDERAWLRALPPLKVGYDAGWFPFSYKNSARKPSGMANDYLDYLSRSLGVTFERVPISPWASAADALQRGEIALAATSVNDGAFGTGVHYSEAFEHYPLVMVGRRTEPMARSLADFAGRRILLAPHAPELQELLSAPDGGLIGAQVARAASLDEGLETVAHNEADVLVVNAAVLDEPLSGKYLESLKVLGAVGVDESAAFAVRGDLAPLARLVDRALDSMTPAEQQQIRNRWTAAASTRAGGWSVNALRLLPLLIVSGVLLLVTMRAYMQLQREMQRRRRAEQVLARQVEQQDTMMEMIPYPLGVVDLDSRFVAINRAYEEATGLQRAQVLGQTGCAIMAWGLENSRRMDELYRLTIADGESQRVELTFENAGGEARHGIFWTRLCRDPQGTPFCVLGTLIDVTDIRRAELRARESERLLSDVTRSVPAIVFQLRRAADGSYSFPYVGGDTQRLPRGTAEALTHASSVDLTRICRRDRSRLAARLERSARRFLPVHTEFRFNGPTGLIWVRAEFAPPRAEDGAILWSGYAVDMSIEHARAEELKHARDMAEAASRAKDDFLAMMSHEIRTPMNGVLGLIEVLERTPLNPDQAQMIGMVHESAGALLQILDDLLDYSKIQAGHLVTDSEPFDVRELVDNAVGLLAARAHEKGLKVRVDVEAGVAALLRGDSVRLRQILFNLLSNAIKFTLEGEVSVRVRALDLGGQVDAPVRQRLSVSVADTGIGIAPEAHAQLFEPFVQAETSTTRRFGGTGLGLTICRKLAALMGGALELESELGRGTCLTLHIELPVEARYRTADDGLLQGKRALVACSDAKVATALMHFGVARGMKMRQVAPAELARAARAGKVDMIFASEALMEGLGKLEAPILCLTEKPKPVGYRVAESGVRVSVNPLSWRGLSVACAMALTGLPVKAPGLARPVDENAITLPAPDREKELATGRLILVAEDHPVNKELIRYQLTLLGFACDVVDDGAQALQALAERDYGCLITDCHMPNVSGYDLARRIREAEREAGDGRRLPILGITANTYLRNKRQCREAGMDDCLIKPTRVAILREHLVRWFGAQGAQRVVLDEAASEGGTTGQAESGAGPAAASGSGTGADRPVSARRFAPLDLAHMIRVWGGEATVKTLLGTFVSSMRDDLDALPPLLEQADVMRLREWHHRLAGAVGVLQYPALLAELETFRRHMNSHTAGQLREEGYALIRTCQEMLGGIEQQAALLT
ncbi:MAG TPA: transporter substrate-binding domain-containing protein [Paraburkholderia sp.]|uniref:ATP-binding protein n=1 Tax=Paraburkholderia sp. TaxID=1926495 RepID=UPI002D0841B1|nr:transporter substrate-binding domain-containing protein [Paraburkholderia sp.]HTR05370.1 transporter substrate-binding domain-containing protein [Paraburkholderia sp.]